MLDGGSTLAVCAAGNSGRDNDAPGGRNHVYPSDFPFSGILSVAACNGRGVLLAQSNYGAVSVDLAAPGFGVESAAPGGGSRKESGTSQAAARVAGRALALWRERPGRGAAELKAALVGSVRIHPSLVGKVVSNGFAGGFAGGAGDGK
jgi:subtilisin family serine protease